MSIKYARRAGEVIRGLIIGALLLVVIAELYLMDSGTAVFRYQGF